MLADDILDFLPDSVAVTGPDGLILFRNKSWQKIAFVPEQTDECATIAQCLSAAKLLRNVEDGRPEILRFGERIYEHRIEPITEPLTGFAATDRHDMHVLRDITESWHLADERHFIERLYRTLSFCNQSLIHADDEQGLAQGVCDGLVRHGGYSYSNVSIWLDDDNGGYQQIAWSAAQSTSPTVTERLHEASRIFIGKNLARLLDRPETERRHPVSVPAHEFAHDFASPLAIECYPLINGGERVGAMIVASTPGEFSRANEYGLLQELASDLTFGLETLRMRERTAQLEAERIKRIEHERDQLAATVDAIAALVEMRDPYTAGHQRRVRALALRIGELLGLTKEQLDGIAFAAGIHDIGKIQVPAEILSKPTSLLAAEFEIIKAHPENGAAILSPIAFPWPVAEIIRQHHERMDGSGYPRGLRGDELLLESRILAIADVVEAMASHRPYRPAHALLDTLQFITRQRGILFDPMVVDACMHLLIQERYALTEGSDKNNPVAGKK